MNPFLDFVVENFPTTEQFLIGGPIFFLWSAVSLYIAAQLKRRKSWRTGYTRKTFHFLTYVSAAFIQGLLGLPWLFVFGGCSSIVILAAILRGPGNPGYEALARESDAPYRTRYIVMPYFATLIGGVTSNVWFGSYALVGFLVTGLGDAVGEPVGTRWGRHRYRPPTWGGMPSERSIEGSTAVFVVSCLSAALAFTMIPGGTEMNVWVIALAVGLAAALAEASLLTVGTILY